MAQHDFSPARALLPHLLARLSRETGRGAHLRPVWEEIVGAVAARNSTPVGLAGRTLIVEVESPRWASELEAQDAEIRSRLDERLGEGTVANVVYRPKSCR
jgi:predicted nucleic acid-binding Zn ribbon protein